MQNEVTLLKAIQPGLNRSEAISAVLIPIDAEETVNL
jgi:hypothetical protein